MLVFAAIASSESTTKLLARLAGLPPKYTDVEKEWLVGAACQKPVDAGYAASVWSTPLLARHANENGGSARLPRLEGISKSAVFRIREYCGKRDPEFEKKSATQAYAECGQS